MHRISEKHSGQYAEGCQKTVPARSVARVSILPAIRVILILSVLCLSLWIAMFFLRLSTTSSQFSGGDFAIFAQSYYNFLHGRPFQSSLFFEDPRQFINPFPFVNILVWHGYFTSTLLLAPLYNIWPSVPWLYTLHILFVFGGIGLFSFLIVRTSAPDSTRLRLALTFSLLCVSCVFMNTVQMAVPSTLLPPFVLAAYYSVLRQSRGKLLLITVLICLLQDDLAIFMLLFFLCLFFWEPQSRPLILLPAVCTFLYFTLWTLVFQPALRYELIPVGRHPVSMLLFRLTQMRWLSPDVLASIPFASWVRILTPILIFFTGILAYAYAAGIRHRTAGRLCALALVPSGAHLLYTLYSCADRHATPVYATAYLAALVFITQGHMQTSRIHTLSARAILVGFGGLAVSVNILLIVPFIPPVTRWRVRDVLNLCPGLNLGHPSPSREQTYKAQVLSNKETLRVVASIPSSASLVFWGNRTLDGYLANRSELWPFPCFYDLSDFLCVQKDALTSSFNGTKVEDARYDMPGTNAGHYWNPDVPISLQLAEAIRTELVEMRKTHTVLFDGTHTLVLRRVVHTPLPVPASSIGFGFVRYISRTFLLTHPGEDDE